MNYKIVQGDCRNMWDVPNESIDLVFTSPPYFNVKDYDNSSGNIGNLNNFDEYMKVMKTVFEECIRTLRDGCFFIINVSDIRSDNVRYNIASYFSIMLTEMGLHYKEDIIWEKFVIVTDKRFGVTLQKKQPRFFYPNNIYEHTLIFLKGNKPAENNDGGTLDVDMLMKKKFSSDVWHIAPDPIMAQKHEAPFPLSYAELVVNLYSAKDEVVLDPFMGSGTTMLASKNKRRNCIGYEISPKYVELIKERIGFKQGSLVGDKFFEVKGKELGINDLAMLVICKSCEAEVAGDINKSNISVTCGNCNNFHKVTKSLWEDYNPFKGVYMFAN